MAQYKVYTPVPGFTGTSVGVYFDYGVAVVSDGPALRYFRNAGYTIEEWDSDQQDEPGADATPDEVVIAGVPVSQPAPGEPLAMEQDPASGHPITDEPARPAGNASTEAWRTYAIARGLDPEEVEGMSRDEIKSKFTDNQEGEEQ